MDTERGDELRRLRERIYGRDADLPLDAEALQRLRELETGGAAATIAPEPAAPEARPATPRGIPAAAEPGAPAPLRETSAAEQDAPPPRRSASTRRRRVAMLWGATVVLAVLATAVVSHAALGGADASRRNGDERRAAMLSEDPGWAVPSFFRLGGAAEARGFAEFHGMRAVVQSAAFLSSTYDACLSVAASEDLARTTGESFSGPLYQGCGASDFSAVVVFKVSGESPDQLRETFPDGTALQFVFDARTRRVIVSSSPPEDSD